tara:strand:- start:544 stop:1104 length:561 start_codon:yes stop_codon:yes gene_type:complete
MRFYLKLTSLFIFSSYLLTSLSSDSSFYLNYASKNWFSKIDVSSTILGKGELKFLGFRVYEIALIGPETINSQNVFESDFALTIKYSRNLKKTQIAKSSKKEISKLGFRKKDELDSWFRWMVENFVDVNKGDTLTGLYKRNFGIILYHNDKKISEKKDVEFAKAFFSIWLAKKTSRPRLRDSLFGK